MSNQPEVSVLSTGVANTASILAGFLRAGAQASLCEDAEQIEAASYVVLPGVGAFGAGMRTLEERNMVEALRRRIQNGAPTLAVCVGLQLLFAESEESPGVSGTWNISGEDHAL